MLNSILVAVSKTGKRNKQIAAECGRSPEHVCEWMSGRCHIPKRMRAIFSQSIGADIDWQAYEAEFSAAQATRAARPAPRPAPALDLHPAADDAPQDAPAPQLPRAAPARPLTAQQARPAPRPTEKPQPRPAPPPSAPVAKGGIFGFLSTTTKPDEKGLFDFT